MQVDIGSWMAKVRKRMAEVNHPQHGKFGGYGGQVEVWEPLDKVLTGHEKQEVRNMTRRHRKAHFNEMQEHYGTTDLQLALKNFFEQVKGSIRMRSVKGRDSSTGCLCTEIVLKKK